LSRDRGSGIGDQGPGVRDQGSRIADPITKALQAYADRGVFRGFRATAIGRKRIEYGFLWLTKKPMTAVFDPAAKRLAFPSVLPQIDPQAAARMKAVVDLRKARNQPDHKRVDARRGRISSAVRKGDFSLAIEIRGSNHEYAVSKALNVINELFVTLQEHHPDYLIERFGFSTE
jgi:hypothetical protein